MLNNLLTNLQKFLMVFELSAMTSGELLGVIGIVLGKILSI